MNKCAPGTGESASFQPASLELRRAQRAFAALLDAHRSAGEFRGAQLRSVAKRTLSALSADDHARLADWLSLQLAAGGPTFAESALGAFARIGMRLAAHVRRSLPHRVEALAERGRETRVVAA